jgi:RNA polymerase sigma factor (sigma-70 family)
MRSTSATLVQRLRNLDDKSGWGRFLVQYRPRLIAWCKQHGLNREESEDVAQDVMTRLVRNLPNFQYSQERNFSGWLRTVWRSAWLDFIRHRHGAQPQIGGSSIQAMLNGVVGGNLADELADQMDREYQRHMLAASIGAVRPLVSQRDWELFERIAFDGESATDVSRSVGMSLAAVGMIKCRIQKKLASHIQSMDQLS